MISLKLHVIVAGANVNGQDYAGSTALHVAAAVMNAGAIAKLLALGAKKNSVDKQNNTPLKCL